MQHFTKSLEKKGIDPVVYTIEVAETKSTTDPLAHILKKLSAADHHFANFTITSNQQKEHVAAISGKTDQHLKGAHCFKRLPVTLDMWMYPYMYEFLELQKQYKFCTYFKYNTDFVRIFF